MLLEGLIIGLIIGIIRNGRLSNLSLVPLRGMQLLMVGLLLQLMPPILALALPNTFLLPVIAFAGMLCVWLVVWRNIQVRGFGLLAIGGFFNWLVVLINGLAMPIRRSGLVAVNQQALLESIEKGQVFNYHAIEGIHWSTVLGKIIALPYPAPLGHMISIGDLFIFFGLIVFIQGEMCSKRHLKRHDMVRITPLTRKKPKRSR